MTILVAVLALIIIFLLLIKGRTGHKELPALRSCYYAHRGLHGDGVPENSMAAFRAAKQAGYGIELDVHLMRDGNLAVIHDSSLKRTADADALIEELTLAQLENYRLCNSQEKIPLFSQVLELYRGVAPLIIELKVSGNNYAALCRSVCDVLEAYKGTYCIESFDPRCIAWLRKYRKNVIRGQLTEDYFKSNSRLPGILKFLLKSNLLNVFTQPDFIAYRFADRNNLSNYLCRKFWGIQGVAWTIRNKEDFETALKENWIPIFENFKP